MLKNKKLLPLLCSPDQPDGALLEFDGDSLTGAGWRVPVVEGIPDFVSHAPPVKRTLNFEIPIVCRPAPEVLKQPPAAGQTPSWFRESADKYPLLDNHQKGFLLDLGSGQGNRQTYEPFGYDYIALDISFNSQQRGPGESDVDVVADCHRIPLRSESLQVVVSTAVLEHVYCPPLVVQEVHRVLKPGGLFIGNCSFLEAEHFDSQYHHTHLGLYRLLTLNGLRVLNLYPGESLWELHSGSIYFGLPKNKLLGRLHRKLYLMGVKLKSAEAAEQRLLRHAAILQFVAVKER